jgi:hypothetical protein
MSKPAFVYASFLVREILPENSSVSGSSSGQQITGLLYFRSFQIESMYHVSSQRVNLFMCWNLQGNCVGEVK